MSGNLKNNLIDLLEGAPANALKEVREVSFSRVYSHRSVVEIEIAGFKIIGTLLEEFVGAIINPKENYSKKVISLFPEQYKIAGDKIYPKIQSAVDFVSGMTDVYALGLYRKIKGISLPGIV